MIDDTDDPRDKAYQAYLAQKSRDAAYEKYLASKQGTKVPVVAPRDALPSPAPVAKPESPGASFVDAPRAETDYEGKKPTGGFVKSIAHGLTGGYSDEILAGANALGDAAGAGLTGAANPLTVLPQAYRQNVAAIRKSQEDYADAHPAMNIAGNVVGGVIPAWASGGESLLANAPKLSMGQKALAGLKAGTKLGAFYGGGDAESGVGNTVAGTLRGAGQGGVVGAATPFGLPAIGATIGAIHGASNPFTGGDALDASDRILAAGTEGLAGFVGGKVGRAAGNFGGRMIGPTIGRAVDAAGTMAGKIADKIPAGSRAASVLDDLMNSTGSRGKMATEIAGRAEMGGKNPVAEADAIDPTIPGFVRGQKFPALANQQTMPADRLGQGVQDFQGDLYRKGGAAGIRVGTSVAERAKAAGPLADKEIVTSLGAQPITNGKEASATLDQLELQRAALGKGFKQWHDANRGDFNDPEIDAVRKTPLFQKLWSKVVATRTDNPFVEPLPLRGSGVPKGYSPDQWERALANMKARGMTPPAGATIGQAEQVPDLEALHSMEKAAGKAVRGVFENDASNPINKDEAAAMLPIVKMLREKIAPQGSDAGKLFAAYRSNRQQAEALETGLNVFKAKDALSVTNMEDAVKTMAPEELDTFRKGVTVALRDRLATKDQNVNKFTDVKGAKILPSSENGMRLAKLAFPDEDSWQTALQQAGGRWDQSATREATLGGSGTVKFGAGQANPFVVGPDVNAVPPGMAYSGKHAIVNLANATAKQGAKEMTGREAGAAANWLTPPTGTAPSSTIAADQMRGIARGADLRANRPSAGALAKLTAAIQANQSFNRP